MRSIFEIKKIFAARFSIIAILLFFFCFNQISTAQYSPAYEDLLHTTYTRQFDKTILLNYLHSGEGQKINSALLSISNSQDTTFAADVINTAADDNELKIFCLESLGLCFQTAQYFWKHVIENPDSAVSNLIGISYTGTQLDFEKIISLYFSNEFDDIPISLILFNFSLRGIKTPDQNNLIADELTKSDLKNDELKSVLYVLSRLKSDDQMMLKLIAILNDQLNQNFDTDIIQYILLAFRRNNFFPEDSGLLNYFTSTDNILLKSLAASTICYKKRFKEFELRKYFQLLYDSNEIAARQTAASLKYLSLADSLIIPAENYLSKLLYDGNLNENVQGELLNSYCVLFPEKFITNEISIPESIPDKFKIRSYANFPNSQKYFDELVRYYNSNDTLIKIESLTSLISFLENETFRKALSEIILDALKSESPALISIAADAVDSIYIIQNQNKLEKILSAQIEKHNSDPNFTESILSILNLSEKINDEFHKKILTALKNSSIYSVKKLVYQKLNLKDEITKVDSNFKELLQRAFKYQAAKIITNKGAFSIRLLPEVAPISVGNFVNLAEENFYNGIIFHRVVPGFVIQAGDKSATGWEGPGYEIISEFSNVSFGTGAVGMASSGKDTEGSQFFVMLGSYPHLNGKYTNFGQLIDGYENLYQIAEGDFIIKIILVDELD